MPCIYCVLCGNRDQSVSYYAFPKKEETRKQWLTFCEIDEHVLNTVPKLCSNHFQVEDIIKKVKGSCLKPNTVPSVREKKRKISPESNSFISKVYCNTKKKLHLAIENINYNVLIEDNSAIIDNQFISQSIIETPDSTTKVKRSSTEGNGDLSPLRDEDVQCSNFQTPMKIKIHEPRFIGDIRTPHLVTPRKAKRALEVAKRIITQQRRKIKTLQQCRNRLVTRITTLKDLLKHLKQKNLLSEAAAENLRNEILEVMNEILKRKSGSRKKFSAELRSFALTLNFYSSKAYKYVRKKFRNLLPESSTIRKWYSVLDGRPGFTTEVLHALKCKVRKLVTPVFCNLVIDEIAIRQQIIYDGNRYYGYVDLGINNNTIDTD